MHYTFIYFNFLNKLDNPWLLVFEIGGLDLRMESIDSMSSFKLPLECLHLFIFKFLFLWTHFVKFLVLEVWINIVHTLDWLFLSSFWGWISWKPSLGPRTFVKTIAHSGIKSSLMRFNIFLKYEISTNIGFIFFSLCFLSSLSFIFNSSKSGLNLQGVNALRGFIYFCVLDRDDGDKLFYEIVK